MRYLLAILLCLPVAALEIVGGSTSQLITVPMRDSSTGQLVTGKAFGDMTITYMFSDDTVDVAVTEVTMTAGTWASGGFIELGTSGIYQFGIPNAALVDGSLDVKIKFVASGVLDATKTIDLIDVDKRAGPNILADTVMVSGDATSADNLELQYDTTGITGDNFPSTQNQVANFSSGTAAISTTAATFVKSGAEPETNTYTATVQEDGVYHIVEDDATSTDAYYQFDIGNTGVPVEILWHGYAQSNGDSYGVFAYNYVGTSYEQVGTILGSNGTTPVSNLYSLTNAHVGTGLDDGLVRFRFLSADGTAFATDRILCAYSVVNPTVGHEGGAIWVDTNASNVGIEPHIDGIADNPVSTWAAALSLNANPALGLKRFKIANGSSITLTGNTEEYTMVGTGWSLTLAGQNINGSYFEGAIITGTATAPTITPRFDRCRFGAVTIPPSIFILSGFGHSGGTFTAGTAGEYVFVDCVSGVAGAGVPVFDFSGVGGVTDVSNRRWSGGVDYTLSADTMLSHETTAGGTCIITTNGANAEIRGITKALTVVMSAAETVHFVGITGHVTVSGTTTGTLDLEGVISDITDTTTAATVTNHAVSQEAIDARTLIAANYFDPAVDAVANVTLVDTTTTNTDMLTAAAVNAEVDTALGDYDGPTNAEMEARTIVAANYFDPSADTVTNVGTVATLTGHTAQTADHTASIATAQSDLDTITDSDGVILGAAGVDLIWDEVLTGSHNVTNSAGRKIRQLSGFVIWEGTAQGPGTGPNQIQLDINASSVDGAYDPSHVSIIDGTGAGQTRLILEYEGSSFTATVDRNWKTAPDATSTFMITANSGRNHVNEGLAQAGASGTITLNALASAIDDTYIGQFVFIRSGTGDDQVRVVISYDGTTKVAIVDRPWDTVPDTTSAYVMMPASPVMLLAATQASLDAIEEDTGTTIPAQISGLNNIDGTSVTLADGPHGGASATLVLSDYSDFVGSGGDATEAKQDLILADIVDMQGATFATGTDSLEAIRNRGDVAWTGSAGGAGSTPVNEDTGGVDVLRYVDGEGAGIEAATITAYVKAEYDASLFTKRGEAVTNAEGRFASNLMLDAGTAYTLVFHKPGSFGPDTVDITP